MLLTVWGRLSFAHRLQKVGGFVIGKAPPTGYPDDSKKNRTGLRVGA
jgi:hypothetical protein